MYDGFIKVACCSPKLSLANCFDNSIRISDEIIKLSDKNVSIVVFPELSITGYSCEDLFLQDALLESAKKALNHIVNSTKETNTIGIVGMPLVVSDKLYNCAVVFLHGEILGIVPKINIPNNAEFYECRHFSSGKDIDICDVELLGKKVKFGSKMIFRSSVFSFSVEICEDLWVAETPSVLLAKSGAQIICNLSASNEVIGKSDYRRTLVKAKSGSLLCGYLYSNAGVGESTTDKVYSGHNIIAENGTIISESELFESNTIISDIDVQKLKHERVRINTFQNNNKDIEYIDFQIPVLPNELSKKYDQYPFVPNEKDILNGRCKEIIEMQSLGLITRLSSISNSCKAVIGLSGGLDSTLALIVTVRAFKKMKRDLSDIKAITMPCFGTTDRTYNNACNLAKAYGVELVEIPIQDSVLQHFKDIGHNEDVHDVTYENSQARERTQVLMDYSNKVGGIVIGTGDLSELALGWATYNADHMSMYNVNCSIPKTLVKYLVRYESDISTGKLSEILNDILNTPVSPELIPPTENGKISQKTESIVGPYALHDFFLYYMLRFGFSPKKIFRLAMNAFDNVYDAETILKWENVFYRRFFSQQFKRSCLPDGPKIGTVTLSPRGDWRMPSDANGKIWFQELEDLNEII
jgi:NAD+ synthase (glutamine-hydrolysing)